jgi:hypothetical protein
MSASPDIRDALTNRLTLEVFGVLSDMYKARANSPTHDSVFAWLQHDIAVAEAKDNLARAMAANMVLKAFAEEWGTPDFNLDRMEERVRQGIQQTVNG